MVGSDSELDGAYTGLPNSLLKKSKRVLKSQYLVSKNRVYCHFNYFIGIKTANLSLFVSRIFFFQQPANAYRLEHRYPAATAGSTDSALGRTYRSFSISDYFTSYTYEPATESATGRHTLSNVLPDGVIPYGTNYQVRVTALDSSGMIV